MKIIVEADKKNLDFVREFSKKTLRGQNCPESMQEYILLVIEEVFINIASYAYTKHIGEACITMEGLEKEEGIWICFEDKGIPFNPLKRNAQEASDQVRKLQPGGLGIILVKTIMDQAGYEYDVEEGKNMLWFIKKWEYKAVGNELAHSFSEPPKMDE